jgi:hypothetical protein
LKNKAPFYNIVDKKYQSSADKIASTDLSVELSQELIADQSTAESSDLKMPYDDSTSKN